MPKIHYRVVPHDGGWAYTLDGAFSEPFPTKQHALEAARRVAREQHVPGELAQIHYQDASGVWHSELSEPGDRPEADVET